jgi:hypothetical protein
MDVSHPAWESADGGSPNDQEAETNVDSWPWTITDTDLTQPSGFWNGAAIVHMDGYGWKASAGTVTSYTQGRLEFNPARWPFARFGIKPGTRYYLANKLAALDTAGEWFFDGSSLYLWALSGDNPSNHTIEAKRRLYAFNLSGRSFVNIRGFNIFASSIQTDTNSSHILLNGIRAKTPRNSMPPTGKTPTIPGSSLPDPTTRFRIAKLPIARATACGSSDFATKYTIVFSMILITGP